MLSAQVLENSHLRASFDLNTQSDSFGAILSIRNKKNNRLIKDQHWFLLKAGESLAAQKKIVQNDRDKIHIRCSQFDQLPLCADISFCLKNDNIILRCKAWVTQKTDFKNGLYFLLDSDMDYVRLSSRNYQPTNQYLKSGDKKYDYLNNCISFYKSNTFVNLVFHNPFHSLWRFNAGGNNRHYCDILPTINARQPDSFPFNPDAVAFSTLSVYDTIFRTITISCGNKIQTPLYFSEHKNGCSNGITVYWDELPNRDNWHFMTTQYARDVVYDHFWVRLMNKFPKLKMGYLLLMDRLLQRKKSLFNHWTVNSPYILADSLDELEGKWCVHMCAQKQSILQIHQVVSCEPSQKYILEYHIKTTGVSGYGAYGVVYSQDNRQIISDTAVTMDTGWQKRILSFTTSEKDTSIIIYLKLEKAVGNAFFDNINISEFNSNTNLIKNAGFETNKPFIVYDKKKRRWVDAHGPVYIPHKAPKKYLQFLRNIENDSTVYGWEDRIRLGSHGYHHTPALYKPDIPGPGWEFQRYDPEGDAERIHCIFRDIRSIGLSEKSLKFWRSPGNFYTASLMHLLADSGFSFQDAGFRNRFVGFVQKSGNRLWIKSLTYWADISYGNEIGAIRKVLNRGHLAQLGGHPEEVFQGATEKSYQRMENLFGTLEREFPNMGYIFPDEYADYANSLYGIRIKEISRKNSRINISLEGKISGGITLILHAKCGNILINNNIRANKKEINGITYVVLPDIDSHINKLTFDDVYSEYIDMSQLHAGIKKNFYRSPKVSDKLLFTSQLAQPIMVFDCRGRYILTVRHIVCNNIQKAVMRKIGVLSPGLYFTKGCFKRKFVSLQAETNKKTR